MKRYFHAFAEKTSHALGTPYAFVLALVAVLIWAALGPSSHYNDTWQLTINTSTTIITFLMVFLVCHASQVPSGPIAAERRTLSRRAATPAALVHAKEPG